MSFKLKKVFAVVLALIIMSVTSSVFAADVTVGSLSISSANKVSQGEEFTVKINLSNFQTSASTVTIIGKIEYDKDKLEYISNSISSNTAEGWDDVKALGEQSFRESNMAFILENRTPSKIGANSNFLTLKFKAKQNLEGTATIKVNVNSVSDATNFSGSSTTVTISKPVEEQQPSEDEQQGEESQGGEQSGGQQQEQPSGSEQQEGSQSGEGQGQQTGEQVVQTQSEKTTNNSKSGIDTTTKKGELPKTGVNSYIWIGIVVCTAIAIINLIYINRIKNNKTK